MASSGSGYDLSAATFSPDGRLFQVEYAAKAADAGAGGGTLLGLRCPGDGAVVLAASKPLTQHPARLVVSTTGSYKRIHTVDTHAGMASTGCLPDARQIVGRAVDECRDFRDFYGARMPPHVLADRLGAYTHYFTLHGAVRPFGAACLLAAAEEDPSEQGAKLFLIAPSGAAHGYHGAAAGQGRQAARTELEKLGLHKAGGAAAGAAAPLTAPEAVRQAVRILTLLFREQHAAEKDDAKLGLEVSWICPASNWEHVPVPADVLEQARAWAREQLDAEQEDEDDDEDEAAMEE